MAQLTSIKSGIYFNNKKKLSLAGSLSFIQVSLVCWNLKWIIYAPSEFLCFCFTLSTGERAPRSVCMCTESSYCSSPFLLRIYLHVYAWHACACVFVHESEYSSTTPSPFRRPPYLQRPIQFPRPSLHIEKRRSKGGEKNKINMRNHPRYNSFTW